MNLYKVLKRLGYIQLLLVYPTLPTSGFINPSHILLYSFSFYFWGQTLQVHDFSGIHVLS